MTQSNTQNNYTIDTVEKSVDNVDYVVINSILYLLKKEEWYNVIAVNRNGD